MVCEQNLVESEDTFKFALLKGYIIKLIVFFNLKSSLNVIFGNRKKGNYLI